MARVSLEERNSFDWGGLERIPDEDWVSQPADAFGLHYDTVENHGWYRNLDLTVEQLAQDLGDGQVLIDYSGGTGILLDRLRLQIGDRRIGMVIVDSSPKFLRIALDRFRSDERVAFRRLRYLKEAAAAPVRRRGPAARFHSRRARLDERDPPLRRAREHATRLDAGAPAGSDGADQLREHPQSARA